MEMMSFFSNNVNQDYIMKTLFAIWAFFVFLSSHGVFIYGDSTSLIEFNRLTE